ncbi:hypothetical protein BDQ17DRAFT_1336248 [Cyathus striatus]|nr:hypothetical protein BDQ17DRAFT_1336248 [Cyathus striatus]
MNHNDGGSGLHDDEYRAKTGSFYSTHFRGVGSRGHPSSSQISSYTQSQQTADCGDQRDNYTGTFHGGNFIGGGRGGKSYQFSSYSHPTRAIGNHFEEMNMNSLYSSDEEFSDDESSSDEQSEDELME